MKFSRALLLAPAALATAQVTEIIDGVESIVSEATAGAADVYTYVGRECASVVVWDDSI